MDDYNNQTNREENKNNTGKEYSPFPFIRILLLLGAWLFLFFTLFDGFGESTKSISIRFDNVNKSNIFELTLSEAEDKLMLDKVVVATMGENSIDVENDYLQELNLYGYTGPITLIEEMLTYNDGDVYYSDRCRITISETTPVEYIHNLASEYKMDVADQDEKSFTLIFRKTLSLAEYKDKMDEFAVLPEVLSVEKIYYKVEE